MNVCIIGDGLTSLSLAKNLINKKINVSIYDVKKKNNLSPSRTIGISKNNLEFFRKEICQFPEKNTWEIKKIEIYSEKLKNDKILNFDNKDGLFYMVKNDLLYKKLNEELSKSKFFKKLKIKTNNFYKKLPDKINYELIINCDSNNPISRKFFSKRIVKDYHNMAYTAILKHEKLENKTATQIFTKFGPIAFLPISNTETSVVFSMEQKKKTYNEKDVLELIGKNNPKYKIKKISYLNNFKLSSSSLRNYYNNNILAFGDLLHKIHPLAGQGFNMTIRDIKILAGIIQDKIDLGMKIDSNILKEFEDRTKHKNFIFSSGVDFIYEFFNFDKNLKDKKLSKILKHVSTNNKLNSTFIDFANKGINL
jgi:2-octaprenyl-6-methoxyphenol hydroxylase